MRLGNAAPRVAAADAQAAARELAAAERALQQAEGELRQARSQRCVWVAVLGPMLISYKHGYKL